VEIVIDLISNHVKMIPPHFHPLTSLAVQSADFFCGAIGERRSAAEGDADERGNFPHRELSKTPDLAACHHSPQMPD
jgi:hypothetical protein